MLRFAYLLLFPFLDRWGGGGFAFLSSSCPWPLSIGFKPARRYALPLLLLLSLPTSSGIVGAILLSIYFHLPLPEYSDSPSIFYSFAALASLLLTGALLPFADAWAALSGFATFLGIYLSNSGFAGRKLAWHYVELLRGLAIAVGVLLNYAL